MKQLTEQDIAMVSGAGWSEDVNKVADRLQNFANTAVGDTSNALNKAFGQVNNALEHASQYLNS
ncbi:chemotaxis protein [Rouxiella sp. Mn2063]|uniref:chemotaxis protein n=1 Tax=Rouxiella sp. Mn2063 TaxID=3395262 RepID=UPI003BC5686C